MKDVTFPLVLTRPHFDRCRTAPPRRYRVALNRYPGCVIGIGVQLGQTWLGVRWGKPGSAAAARDRAAAVHRPGGIGNAMGDYDCVCGEPWLDTLGGCLAAREEGERDA